MPVNQSRRHTIEFGDKTIIVDGSTESSKSMGLPTKTNLKGQPQTPNIIQRLEVITG